MSLYRPSCLFLLFLCLAFPGVSAESPLRLTYAEVVNRYLRLHPEQKPSFLKEAHKKRITDIRLKSALEEPQRPGPQFTEKELGVAIAITQVVPCSADAYLEGLCLIFSVERAETLLERIIEGQSR